MAGPKDQRVLGQPGSAAAALLGKRAAAVLFFQALIAEWQGSHAAGHHEKGESLYARWDVAFAPEV